MDLTQPILYCLRAEKNNKKKNSVNSFGSITVILADHSFYSTQAP